MITTKDISQEINRPIVLAQASEEGVLLRLTYFPETKIFKVTCKKHDKELPQYEYEGKITHNAVTKYNDAYKELIHNSMCIDKV